MPGDVLDLILLVLIAAFAVAGYRQGFIIGVLSLAGFVIGVSAGAYIAPGISRALAKSVPWQAFVAIVVVFAAAVLGMLLASGIGVAIRSRVTGAPATVIDSLGGAAVNIVAVVVVAWLIGSFMINAPFPSISRQVNDSLVLRTVDRLMPPGTLYLPVFPQLRSLLSNGLYSQVFSAIGAETSLGLPPGNPAVLSSAAVRRAELSVVKIEGVAPSCSLQIEGSGFVISRAHVLTNAHVVAGVTEGPYVHADGRRFLAKVVLYDPQRDLAVLYVPGLPERPLEFADSAAVGTSAAVAGYPLNDPLLKVVAARIGHSISASGPNIYQDALVTREIYPIRAQIEPGNSGGPLLSSAGRVYGVVFAASTSVPETGYALTASEVVGDASRGMLDYTPVSTQACQSG